MYLPADNRIEDPAVLRTFMREHPLALLVSVVDDEPFATPVPVTVCDGEGGLIVRGHLARANPQANVLDGATALVVFDGPHAYVSPRHYDAAESVPTWNYVTVHATGTARALPSEDVPAHEALLAELIAEHEPSYQRRWDAMPERFRTRMLRGIVGFEVEVARLEGKAKLSQNKREGERRRIAAALAGSSDAAARAVGRWMEAGVGLGPSPAAAHHEGGPGDPVPGGNGKTPRPAHHEPET